MRLAGEQWASLRNLSAAAYARGQSKSLRAARRISSKNFEEPFKPSARKQCAQLRAYTRVFASRFWLSRDLHMKSLEGGNVSRVRVRIATRILLRE